MGKTARLYLRQFGTRGKSKMKRKLQNNRGKGGGGRSGGHSDDFGKRGGSAEDVGKKKFA